MLTMSRCFHPNSVRCALCFCTSLALVAPGVASATEYSTEQKDTEVVLAPDEFSPYAGRNYPTQVFWGDQHVRSGWSMDAGTSGTG